MDNSIEAITMEIYEDLDETPLTPFIPGETNPVDFIPDSPEAQQDVIPVTQETTPVVQSEPLETQQDIIPLTQETNSVDFIPDSPETQQDIIPVTQETTPVVQSEPLETQPVEFIPVTQETEPAEPLETQQGIIPVTQETEHAEPLETQQDVIPKPQETEPVVQSEPLETQPVEFIPVTQETEPAEPLETQQGIIPVTQETEPAEPLETQPVEFIPKPQETTPVVQSEPLETQQDIIPVTQETEPVVHSEPLETQQDIIPVTQKTNHVVNKIPKLIFIVPYRDREQHLQFFSKTMAEVLSSYSRDDVRILYVHQCDTRSFNRGAMKNIGFLTVKKEYPDTYRDITLVFNDVDTMPYSKDFLNYETVRGKVKHFYGYTFTLGGIVSIKAGDFEIIRGFPNLWAWGYEDNLLKSRVLKSGIHIDRSQFYPIMDKNILHLCDELNRTVNRKEFDVYIGSTSEGFHSITNLKTVLEPRENNLGLNETFVQVLEFNTGRDEDKKLNSDYDITKGNKPFGDVPILQRRRGARMNMVLR